MVVAKEMMTPEEYQRELEVIYGDKVVESHPVFGGEAREASPNEIKRYIDENARSLQNENGRSRKRKKKKR